MHYNLNLNGYVTDYVTHAALCDYNGSVELNVYENANGRQSILDQPEIKHISHRKVMVPSITAQTFLYNNKIAKIDLLKIDIEGMELVVLEQIKNMLKLKKISELIIEANNMTLQCLGKNAQDVKKFFAPYPYELYGIRQDGVKCPLPDNIRGAQTPIDILAVLK